MTLSKEELKETIEQVLDERAKIDSKTHLDHHYFVAKLMKDEASQEDFWGKIKQQVLGWGMITVIGFFGYHLLDSLKEILIHILNKTITR